MSKARLTRSETEYLGRALAHLGVPKVDVQVNPKSKKERDICSTRKGAHG